MTDECDNIVTFAPRPKPEPASYRGEIRMLAERGKFQFTVHDDAGTIVKTIPLSAPADFDWDCDFGFDWLAALWQVWRYDSDVAS